MFGIHGSLNICVVPVIMGIDQSLLDEQSSEAMADQDQGTVRILIAVNPCFGFDGYDPTFRLFASSRARKSFATSKKFCF